MSLAEAILKEDLGEIKRLLVEQPPIVDDIFEGLPMSFLAAKTGNTEIVKYIVEYSRASMNTVDGLNRNILHYAVQSGSLETVKYLVEKVGMSPVWGDRELLTPYDIAHKEGHEQIEKYFEAVTGFGYEETYRNPIRTGMFPDPSIVRVGEDYYMVNSSFIFFPCIPVSHSRDLVHWEIIGHAITDPDWAGLDELEGGRGYWAPDISYYNGRFYIAATYRLNDTGTVYRRQMVVSSDKPEGPYSKPVFLEEDGIDPSIFNDDDGRRYMLLNRGARIFELNKDATEQISPAVLLFYGDHKRAPEGPHLLKKDGYYYLFEAEGGTGEGHRITVSRSRTLMGNYEPCPYNPIMRQEDVHAAIQRCGHGKPVCTQNGDWYMVYLCGRQIGEGYSILGRETALDPITWTADGWPLVNGLKGPSAIQKLPLPPEPANLEETDRLLFKNGKLTCEWMTPRPPEKDGVTVKENALYIRGSQKPLSDVGARNIVVRRQKEFCFRAETEMSLLPMEIGQESGLLCYYDENTWVSWGIEREKDGYYIQVKEHIGEENRVHGRRKIAEKVLAEHGGTEKRLCLSVETVYLKRTFRCSWQEDCAVREIQSVTLENVCYLCDEGLKKGKRFTGAMVGMYAYAGAVKYEAKFHRFHYSGNISKNN